MDFIVSLLHTQKGCDGIWVVVDRLTKMAKFIPMRSKMIAQDLAYLFVNELFSCYRLLMDIVIVRDTKFRSDFWMQVFKKLENTLSMSSINHPQYDG